MEFVIRTSWQETVVEEPLDFVVVGAGQVFSKYLKPAVTQGQLNIQQIMSLENQETFQSRHETYANSYTQVQDDASIIRNLILHQNDELNVMLVTPAKGRLQLVEQILLHPGLNHARIYIEKPFAYSIEEIEKYKQLVKLHSSRLHFATRFAESRSDILRQILPENRVPQEIQCNFIEGTEQYLQVKNNPNHYYRNDGPESDLGFHLLHSVANICTKLGDYKRMEIESVVDLKEESPDQFEEKGLGIRCNLKLYIGNEIIPIQLIVGKGNTAEFKRTILNYGEFAIEQMYAHDNVFRDPVFIRQNGDLSFIKSNDARYGDFTKSFRASKFCHQTIEEQLLALDIAKVCFEMKQIRLKR